MHSIRRLSRCAAIVVTLLGCGGDGRPAPSPSPTGPPDSLPLPPPIPIALTQVSGNEQRVLLGSMLDDPLVVLVTDRKGAGIAGVPVEWAFNGTASICLLSEANCRDGSLVVPTDAFGRSTVLARPVTLHRGGVTAVVTTNPALHATFTMDVIGVLIRAQPLFDCVDDSDPLRFTGHVGGSHTVVDVGTPVEFEFAKWLVPGCMARIVSTSAPPGDPGFDSGNLGPGQRFRFVPTVAGTWEFRDQYSGGVGWLTAGPLPTPPAFPPLSRPATIYDETGHVYRSGADPSSVTRFVFFDDGTFQPQFSSQRHGWFAYDGWYRTTESIIALAFKNGGPAGKWEATGSVSGDTLTVNYNQLMKMDDFIDARYIRAR